jgi:hypothetical protein
MIDSGVKQVIINASLSKRSSWAIIRNGAVAEFSITDSDINTVHQYYDNDTNILTVETPKAILELEMNKKLNAIIAENANFRCSPWSQNIYLCIAKKDSEIPTRNKLTCIGEWKKKNMNGVVWDLGIGYGDFQAKIIVTNENLQSYLKQKEGEYIVDDSKFLKTIVEFSPARMFSTKFASIIVKQKIPTRRDEIDGPHTHLLPHIILNRTNFPIPIGDDMSSQIQVDPFGAVIDGNGKYNEWMGFEKDEFQVLMKQFGRKIVYKNKILTRDLLCNYLEINDFQSISKMYNEGDKPDDIRIILAQIVCDKNYSQEIRKKGILALEKIRAINVPVLKSWIKQISPELVN